MGCGSSKADAALKAALRAAEGAAEEAAAELEAAKAETAALKAGDAEDAKAAAVAAGEESSNFALASHLSAIIGIVIASPDIQRYASNLRREGYDLPEDFDELTVEELKGAPFCLKPGHLKKVVRSRSQKKANSVSQVEPNAKPTVRGRCSLCGLEVLDSQQRLKDPDTGLYHHENCHTSSLHSATTTPRASVAGGEVTTIDADPSQARTDADTAVQIETVAMGAGAQTTTPTESAGSPVLPLVSADPRTKPLLPEGKHAFLSYQWDVQGQVKGIKALLNERQVKCWMDIDGGMKSDIYDSMAEGVQGAACLICFMTQAYQDSANCKLELKFAQQSGVPIIPVMMQPNFTAKGWLGILTSGSIWTPMYDSASVVDGVDKLITQAQHVVPGMRGEDEASDTASEASDATESFDVGAWGDEMFSLDEMKQELERLREDHAPSTEASKVASTRVGEDGPSLCSLPAMVPTLPRGIFVTAPMQCVLDAVLSDTSTPQIGFCGMGGIGKTTVSCWVTRSDATRTKFGMVAWITLGQTPVLDACINLLYLQLKGSALPDGGSPDQKQEMLQQAFLNRSVLLILDDCWDADVAKQFTWIDQSTNSKVLISSRVRDVLDGGDVIDVAVPSQSDAVKMLLSTAEMDIVALQEREEVSHVVELCKRLPLTIGVAGKLIRQLAQGSSMSEAGDWTDVLACLEDEMNDPGGSLSIEESVIRASVKAIPARIRQKVTQLFHAFALVPEDMHVPLPVLGMIYDACDDSTAGSSGNAVSKPLTRLQVRRCLKILIDRSLVLGTVDRPQLHDVMLDYVQKELAGAAFTAAQRRLVESLRTSDRSAATVTGKYIRQCIRHHITKSYDATWEKSPQAVAWLEDHVSGVQDVIAASAAVVLPAEALAKEAEAAEMWWKAALRYNAFGMMKRNDSGDHTPALPYFKLAVAASAHVVVAAPGGSGSDAPGVSQFDVDTFDLFGINSILKSWNPLDVGTYSERMEQVVASKAGISRPLMCFAKVLAFDWYPAMFSGNDQAFVDENWKLIKMILDMCDPTTETYALTCDEDRAQGKPLMAMTILQAGDAIVKAPLFDWGVFGTNGDTLVEHHSSYVYDEHHYFYVDVASTDFHIARADTECVLTLQYGRIADAREMMADKLVLTQKLFETTSAGNMMSFVASSCFPQVTMHFLRLTDYCRKHYDILGITFDNAEELIDTVTKAAQGSLFAAMEQKEPNGSVIATKRIVWQVKAFCVLLLDVPDAKAIAWLQSLPDDEAVYAYSMTFPTHDVGAFWGSHQFCWLALAHEKVGLYEGALRFAGLQFGPVSKAGYPLAKWAYVVAFACKGRVLAKLDRHDEALSAFQAGIAASKESYSLMEAFALRELANYGGGGGAAAVQAGKDLEAKLQTFEGRMTRAEFDGLTIGPQ